MTVSVHLPDELVAQLADEATRRGISVDELTAELIASRLPLTGVSGPRRLAFSGIGASTSGRSAADAEQLLAEGFGRD
ncbi:MAG: ribbon-helix-helix domain-containing protein [Mycobacteriales bacterium]